MSTLAAARADNFYYPKNWDPSKGNINKFQSQKRRPEGSKPKPPGESVPVIRFEMPFHVRCMQCNNMIAKGVRFNAGKKEVGKYMSTKIYEFSMKCPRCPNQIVIKTDPKGCDYITERGARRYADQFDAKDAETIEFKAPDEAKKMQNDPFYKLESERADKLQGEIEAPRLQAILDKQSIWEDDYRINRALRKKFKAEKKVFEKLEEEERKPKNFALPLPELAPEDEEAAKKIKFMGVDKYRENRLLKREVIRKESIFSGKRANEDRKEQTEIVRKLIKLPMATQKLLEKQKEKKESWCSGALKYLKKK